MSTELLALPALGSAIIGAGAGIVGSLMILRRMALVGDALSHVALPGIAAAILLGINPFVGAFGALVGAVVGIWGLERRSRLPSEALVGIFFTVSLALGILLTPEPELLEALFGDIGAVTRSDVLWTLAAVLCAVVITTRIMRPLVLGVLSEDLAQVSGVRSRAVSLLFLLIVALIVALGIRFTGTLLTGSLVIIPAATARNITRSLTSYTLTAGILGALTGYIGTLIAGGIGIPAGPAIILFGALLFVISLATRQRD